MPDAKAIQLRLRAELARLKAAGAPREEIDAEIAAAQSVIDEISAQDPERQHKPSLVEQTLTTGLANPAFLETAGNSWGLGVPGLVADAIDAAVTPRTFSQNRESRKLRRESLPAGERLGAEVIGAVLSPANGLVSASKGAGRLKRTGAAMADAGIQSGVTGGLNAVDDYTPEALADAARVGGKAGLVGGVTGGVVGGLSGSASRTAQRLGSVRRLDKQALDLERTIKEQTKKNYGIADAEATATPPITKFLSDDPVVGKQVADSRFIADYTRTAQNDAQTAMDVYRRLSDDEGAILDAVGNKTATEGQQGKLKLIRAAKQKLLAATEEKTPITTLGRAKSVDSPYSDTPDRVVTQESRQEVIPAGIPSLRPAIDAKRVAEQERSSFERGSDMARGLGASKVLAGKNILPEGKAHYLEEEIPKMTPREAQLALSAFLGRGSEAVRASNNPIGLFGLASSAARLPLTMYRTRDVVEALEKQAGVNLSDQAFAKLMRGITAKTVGAEVPR